MPTSIIRQTIAGEKLKTHGGMDDPSVRALEAGDFVARNDGEAAEARVLGGPVCWREEVAGLASPSHSVTSSAPPFFLVHDARDEIVPVAQSERLYAALAAANIDATFVRFARAGHDLFSCWDEVRQMMLSFFQKHPG